MTYPHRPGQKAGVAPLNQLSTPRWTVRKAQPSLGVAATPVDIPMRRYEVMAITPAGEFVDEILAAPAAPLFESAFTAMARGALVATEDGPVAVEDLIPGMRVETRDHGAQKLLWVGATTLVPRTTSAAPGAGLYRIPMDAFGPQRPMPDLMLGPNARLLHRAPALSDLVGADQALVPVQAFEDGMHMIRVTPVSPVRVFHLGFAAHEVISVNGLEIESFHPGAEVATRLAQPDLERYLRLFPHVTGLAGFGPLTVPRISAEACDILTAA